MRYFLLLFLMSCAACRVQEDVSTPPASVGDHTLIMWIDPINPDGAHSPCLGIPNGGYDVCRFVKDAKIEAVLNILIPTGGKVKGGSIVVFYKDIQKSYAPKDNLVQIPFADFFQAQKWSKDLEGEMEVVGIIQFEDDRGIIKEARALGMARILVFPAEYSVMPIDSGVQAWDAKVKCKLQYATSGRSAYRCEND